jgi:hypothetical protein
MVGTLSGWEWPIKTVPNGLERDFQPNNGRQMTCPARPFRAQQRKSRRRDASNKSRPKAALNFNSMIGY